MITAAAGEPPDLTVVILTFNEAHHIARAIQSVRNIAREILVIDSFSSDATVTLAQALGARALHEFQVIDVIHHATGIGILVIDTTTVCDRFQAILRAHTLVLTPQLANPQRQLFFFINVELPERHRHASGRTTKSRF